jgi:hypothetical protein
MEDVARPADVRTLFEDHNPQALPDKSGGAGQSPHARPDDDSIINHRTIIKPFDGRTQSLTRPLPIFNQAIIGVRSRIGENCRVERAVIMGSDFFESDADNYAIVNGIIVVPKNAVIPRETVI